MHHTEAATRLQLHGVDHTARPTWKLKETVEFYRDVVGLPLIHAISARGWGPATHPDFLHFFFDSGKGSTIAFFYYLGEEEPEAMRERPGCPPMPSDHVFDATHTSWLVESREELLAWKARLEAKGVQVSVETAHEVIESIYFRDPNGYFIEITRKLRPLEAIDAEDAAATLAAAIEVEQGGRVTSIDEVWRRKAARMQAADGANNAGAPVAIQVLEVPEFAALVEAARAVPGCRISQAQAGYTLIESDAPLQFERRALGLKPAVWYGLFTGGLRGRIEQFDRDLVRIVP